MLPFEIFTNLVPSHANLNGDQNLKKFTEALNMREVCQYTIPDERKLEHIPANYNILHTHVFQYNGNIISEAICVDVGVLWPSQNCQVHVKPVTSPTHRFPGQA